MPGFSFFLVVFFLFFLFKLQKKFFKSDFFFYVENEIVRYMLKLQSLHIKQE
jgi:hypothetical protein